LTSPRITPLGDSAVTLTYGEGISEELNDRVVDEAKRIAEAKLLGIHDVVAAYASLTIHYDPLRIGYADLRSFISSLSTDLQTTQSKIEKKSHVIPVRYNGEDLQDVAERTGLPVEDVIAIHSSVEYRVFVTGFIPGWAYLGVLDKRLVLPRRDSPRKRVPAGSVAIAEAQTGVYPSETPGGWHLIGTADVRMFDPDRSPPALLAVGDRVKFVPE
jgi:KipI family sensor histidine kinase inhibitor